MKTVAELSLELGIDRSTLLKAAQDSRLPARRSGATWLIDDESEGFKWWLAGSKLGRPRRPFPETIEVETPDVPNWVTTPYGKQAWKNSLEWRANAGSANTEQYRNSLLSEAEQMYGNK